MVCLTQELCPLLSSREMKNCNSEEDDRTSARSVKQTRRFWKMDGSIGDLYLLAFWPRNASLPC